MTTFQLVLAGLAALLVLGVVLYNIWQERKYRRELDRRFGRADSDESDIPDFLKSPAKHAQAERPRIEPHLGEETEAAPAVSAEPEPEAELGTEIDSAPPDAEDVAGVAVEETFEADLEEPALEPAPAEPAGELMPESPLDPETEYLARLRLAQPSLAPFAALLEALRALGKPVRAMAKREDGGWEPLTGASSGRFAVVEFGLQLANRDGPVSNKQIEDFCRVLYAFAAEHGGAVSCQDRALALSKAHDLDAFCIEVDFLVGLNVVAPDARPFRLTEIQRLATEAGMQRQPDGSYVLRDLHGGIAYSLVNQGDEPFPADAAGGTTHGITFLFDVTSAGGGVATFDHMAGLAAQMARALGGNVVDDNGRHVGADSLQKIRQRLAKAHADMAARDIPAGGERARRLFA